MGKNKLFKNIITMILLGCSLSFFSCSKEKKEVSNKKSESFDISETVKVAEKYMDKLVQGDYDACKSFYSEDLKSELLKTPGNLANEVPIMGYKIEESNQVGYSGMIKINVSRASLNTPSATLHQYIMKISKKDDKYVIESIISNNLKETFSKGRSIRIRSKNDVKTNLLVNFSGMPKYAFSKDDKGELFRLKVPMNYFGSSCISYTGEKVCINTTDSKDNYLAVLSVDESLKTIGEEEKKQGDEENSSEVEEVKEKPIGKDIFSLDILKDTKVIHMDFSPDEGFIEVSYERPFYGKFIRIYNTSNGDIIPFSFEEEYNIKNADLEFVKFDKSNVIYKVIPKEKNSVGTLWQLDLKKFKATKVQ